MRSSFSISVSRTCTLSLNFSTRTARPFNSPFAAALSALSSSYRLAFTISPNRTSMKPPFIPICSNPLNLLSHILKSLPHPAEPTTDEAAMMEPAMLAVSAIMHAMILP
ncbi:unnamed protein product [Linum trigynum]|uniref:Uncharacterized protein n=1 Tax=Linum trigynum TaxID=586398 RepID=A0AAV2EXM8_9ROSI